jgi:hypothetical protein
VAALAVAVVTALLETSITLLEQAVLVEQQAEALVVKEETHLVLQVLLETLQAQAAVAAAVAENQILAAVAVMVLLDKLFFIEKLDN